MTDRVETCVVDGRLALPAITQRSPVGAARGAVVA